ncbi:MAG: hypothetical protein CMN93_00660 [Synechococcus sp. CPC35]|nr:hypothetical protein [Synechococcus sp. CPC35]
MERIRCFADSLNDSQFLQIFDLRAKSRDRSSDHLPWNEFRSTESVASSRRVKEVFRFGKVAFIKILF